MWGVRELLGDDVDAGDLAGGVADEDDGETVSGGDDLFLFGRETVREGERIAGGLLWGAGEDEWGRGLRVWGSGHAGGVRR